MEKKKEKMEESLRNYNHWIEKENTKKERKKGKLSICI